MTRPPSRAARRRSNRLGQFKARYWETKCTTSRIHDIITPYAFIAIARGGFDVVAEHVDVIFHSSILRGLGGDHSSFDGECSSGEWYSLVLPDKSSRISMPAFAKSRVNSSPKTDQCQSRKRLLVTRLAVIIRYMSSFMRSTTFQRMKARFKTVKPWLIIRLLSSSCSA